MFIKLLKISIVLTFIVIALGAYTRLSNAGLGCPDWPGCYGMLIPSAELSEYNGVIDIAKAWKEMLHRYTASILGLVVICLFLLVILRKTKRHQSLMLPLFLVAIIIFQGALGRWTVTELVHPNIVSIHLIVGFITMALLFWLLLNQKQPKYHYQYVLKQHRSILLATLLLLITQIFLGGWTSANYAALACGNTFPTCLGEWLPQKTNFQGIFFWGEYNTNYEFGVLDNGNRVAIQILHRIGALIVTLAIIVLVISFKHYHRLRNILTCIVLLLVLQITLGILNVVLSLPISIAVLHNIVALGLFLGLIQLLHKTYKSMSF